jgi:bacillithiol biosynthesis cysteine-adding enzyme BshC
MPLSIHPPSASSPAATPPDLVRRAASTPRPIAPAVLARWSAWLDRLDPPAAVRRNFDRLRSGAAAIVSGQQAGVLGGPLLALLKASRAVSLAAEVETASGKPIVPVFWIAGDDHDLDEIHHTFVLNKNGEVQKLRLELGGARGAASTVAVPADGARLVRELFEVAGIAIDALAPEPFLPRAGDTLSLWFARVLLQLLGPHGIVPFSPELLGEAAQPLFERALRDDAGAALERALRAGADALAKRGVEAPLPVESDPPLFVLEPGARTHVRRRDGKLFVGNAATTRAELLALDPNGARRLSANVALRTILQAACLPALAYVAGPTEAKYYEQLAPLHAWFEVPFPVVVPRPAATVLSKGALRAMRKLGVAPAELFGKLAARAAPAASSVDASPWLVRGKALRDAASLYVEELGRASPALGSAAARRGAQLLGGFDALLDRVRAALAEGDEHARARWILLDHCMRPGSKPQDRVLNALPFFAEHGPELIDAMLRLRSEPDGKADVPPALVFAEEPVHG